MEITDLTLTLFAWDDIPATRYAAHTGRFAGSSQLGLLTLATDQGVEGHAFLGSAYNPAHLDGPMLIHVLKPIVLGQDPLERERLYRAMWKRARAVTVRAIGAVDVALWDIAGKVAGLPIHKLIGGYRDAVPVYASSQVLSTPEAYGEQAQHFKSLGWQAYKIHPPMQWRDDIKACEAVRRAVGDNYTLMLDSTWSYEYAEALRVGRAIEELGFYWYEDPLADADIYNYIKLKQKLDIPIMATEYPIADFFLWRVLCNRYTFSASGTFFHRPTYTSASLPVAKIDTTSSTSPFSTASARKPSRETSSTSTYRLLRPSRRFLRFQKLRAEANSLPDMGCFFHQGWYTCKETRGSVTVPIGLRAKVSRLSGLEIVAIH